MAHRTARILLLIHVALVLFSTVAMLTILAGPPGSRTAQEPAATVMRLSYRFAGPAYVTMGALCGLAFLARALGPARALTIAAAASGMALAAELVGTSSALPFGDYTYSAMLGYRVMGRVPLPIPLSWFYMLVGALAIVARLRPAGDGARNRWRWSVLAALLLVAWDVAMDPAMVATGHWRWGTGEVFRQSGLPDWAVAFFTRDAFYGMPAANWFGWMLTATIVARVMLALVPPSEVAGRIAPSRLPIVLYLANGIMPVALCLREGYWWAAGAGAIAMAAPATMALSRRRTGAAIGSAPEPA